MFWIFRRILLMASLGLGFMSGQAFEAWRYEARCQDLGGGRTPGGLPICVLTEQR
ncbi:hypothetical protein GCM10011415_42570 [Salipiger pallidus]|uniref:Uncharacterized protein n=1 Tax=Salipiger pallidus TaxID=1775170 RepID=A0A8J2ZNV8_9RHOB|nr:hypothetical protein [Salipiger pallidus]GGG87491.1 hypothetical protein GCM10011415_42570 [Salipiger pallidus]